jgi:predicted GNAT superfamily acetyltransferase
MPTSAAPSIPTPAGVTGNAVALALEIRPLRTWPEYHACVALQQEIWGAEFEVVPASLMLAAEHIGALALGAFARDGSLQGFVFGLTGVRAGELAHWSHMLGVRTAYRDRGIGRRLKEQQLAELAARGIQRVYWTFDPLQARNAHLNLNRLNAQVLEYVVDMYGASQSPLHCDLATDRLVVECSTSAVGESPARAVIEGDRLPVLTPYPHPGDVLLQDDAPPRALLEVPWDLQEVVVASASTAAQWRAATREHFQWALRNRYVVTGVHRTVAARRVFFILERAADPADRPPHSRGSNPVDRSSV